MPFRTLKSKGIPFKYKDGFGAGNSATENVVPNNVVNDKETYIGGKGKKEVDMNKINHTKVGDDIHYYQNGIEGRGIVVKMSNEYVMVAKEDGDFEDIHINDTFFVKDIVLNKTWDNMDSGERMGMLMKAHAPSARFVTKDWYNLPRELREVLTKFTGSTSEAGISRPDETKTYRDQDKSLAANAPTTEDEQSEGFRKDEKKAGKKGLKCVSCGKVIKAKKGKLSEFLGRFADKNPNDLIGSINAGTIEGQQKIQAGESADKPTKIKKPKTASDVEHGAYGAISTDTPLDVSDDTGYEERPHLCAECVGNLPREDAKGHHDKEIEDKKSPAKVKEPHVVEGETSHPTDKSDAFGKLKPVYEGKKRKKGVPEWNVNTWGMNYTVKEDEG